VRRTLLFALLALGLAAQAVFIDRFVEPFPTITMPSFGGTGGHRGDRLKRTDCTVAFGFADGRVVEVPRRELLKRDLPVGRHNEAMKLLCGLGHRSDRHDRIRSSFPSYRWGATHDDDPQAAAALTRWARRAAHRVDPAAEPVWIELRRERIRIAHGPKGLDVQRTVRRADRIPLTP
jgi:hypothetical protein